MLSRQTDLYLYTSHYFTALPRVLCKADQALRLCTVPHSNMMCVSCSSNINTRTSPIFFTTKSIITGLERWPVISKRNIYIINRAIKVIKNTCLCFMLSSTGAVLRDPSGSSLFSFQMGLVSLHSDNRYPPKKVNQRLFWSGNIKGNRMFRPGLKSILSSSILCLRFLCSKRRFEPPSPSSNS